MFDSPLASKLLANVNMMLASRFYPLMRVPVVDLTSRTAIVTGANTGIGLECARKLAGMGAHVVLACRDVQRGNAARDDILSKSSNVNAELVTVEQLDLSDGKSSGDFVKRWDRKPLDILVNNAGATLQKYTLTTNTPPGRYETTYYVNLLSHIQLTLGLLPALSPGARIVNVSSIAQYSVWDSISSTDLDWSQHITKKWGLKEGDPWTPSWSLAIYARIKFMQVAFAKELQARLESSSVYASKDITVYSCHPGLVQTGFVTKTGSSFAELSKLTSAERVFVDSFDRFGISPEQGACTPVFCAVAPEAVSGKGGYFDRMKQRTPNGLVKDKQLVTSLWNEWMKQINTNVAKPL